MPNMRISLESENEALYNFLEESTLKQYLYNKTGVRKDEYTFTEVHVLILSDSFIL